jgi:2-aminoadipate transaminase
MEISKYLDLYDIDAHIEKIREVYRKRRDLAVQIFRMEEKKIHSGLIFPICPKTGL